MNRREFCRRAAACSTTVLIPGLAQAQSDAFRLRYIVASCMYGKMKLEEILPEIPKTGAEAIDIWPAPHGDQREQVDAMGLDAFKALLEHSGVRLGIITRYDLGPFALHDEMAVAQTLGAKILVSGGSGPKGLEGDPLKTAVREFVEKMKPEVAAAEAHGCAIAIENHANNLIESSDAITWLAEFAPSKHLGVALAPYHLEQDPAALTALIETLGERLLHFYAWQHGLGCMDKRPREEELLQMPGRGALDFAPILAALERIRYAGWTSIFMHPVPRGIPILPTAAEVTSEIDRARTYLDGIAARA